MNDGSDLGKAFLGAGIACSVTTDAQGAVHLSPMTLTQGVISTDSFEEHIRNSILLILQTAPGERVMRPDFGAGLSQLLFEPLIQATIALAQHNVRQALIRFEPRIEVLEIDVIANPQTTGRIDISLNYRVRSTDTTFNLVYPFFLERGEQ
jgi:phage baseplate assembly protein W